MKAMIFAAGLGSRLKPWTDHHPKALAMVNGRSLLQRNIEYLQKNGIFQAIVNVHHFGDQVIEAIEKNKGWGTTIAISDERNTLLETGGGLQKAEWYFMGDEDLVVMNVDILTDMDLPAMIRQHEKCKPLATLAVSDRETSRYFLFDDKDILSGWENVKTGEKKIVRNTGTLLKRAFSGIHIINTDIFSQIKQQGKFSMIDVYLDLAKENIINSYDHSGSKLIDVGKPESIQKAEAIFS